MLNISKYCPGYLFPNIWDLYIWYLAIIGELDNSFLSGLEPRKLTCVEMSVFFQDSFVEL